VETADAEHLPGLCQSLPVQRLAHLARAVDRRVAGGIGEHREHGAGRRRDGRRNGQGLSAEEARS